MFSLDKVDFCLVDNMMTTMLPRRAERTVITARAAMAARKTVSLLLRMARMAAMKKVLSPSSDT